MFDMRSKSDLGENNFQYLKYGKVTDLPFAKTSMYSYDWNLVLRVHE